MKNSLINYVEFKAGDLKAIKEFYTSAFGWQFTDYGPNYVAFSESGLEGGFEKSDEKIVNGALVILYHENLNDIKSTIIASKGNISKDIFHFQEGEGFISSILLAMSLLFGLTRSDHQLSYKPNKLTIL